MPSPYSTLLTAILLLVPFTANAQSTDSQDAGQVISSVIGPEVLAGPTSTPVSFPPGDVTAPNTDTSTETIDEGCPTNAAESDCVPSEEPGPNPSADICDDGSISPRCSPKLPPAGPVTPAPAGPAQTPPPTGPKTDNTRIALPDNVSASPGSPDTQQSIILSFAPPADGESATAVKLPARPTPPVAPSLLSSQKTGSNAASQVQNSVGLGSSSRAPGPSQGTGQVSQGVGQASSGVGQASQGSGQVSQGPSSLSRVTGAPGAPGGSGPALLLGTDAASGTASIGSAAGGPGATTTNRVNGPAPTTLGVGLRPGTAANDDLSATATVSGMVEFTGTANRNVSKLRHSAFLGFALLGFYFT